MLSDTIAAIASPAGTGALSLIRVSGERAAEIVSQVIPTFDRGSSRRPHLAPIRSPDTGDVLDQAIHTFFPGPGSFTGEDVVEITTHGGLFIPYDVLAAIMAAGARQARPGEFSMRAVFNGKMDLLQAEAVGDLVDSTAAAQRTAALAQLDKGLSRRIEKLKARVLDLEAFMSYDIDFPEEDDGPISQKKIVEATKSASDEIEALLATAHDGEMLREGALVVIAGRPNSGKSSLFNAMIGFDRAIVTDIAGTTRDAIEAPVSCDGFPIRLVDTAGLRESDDFIEQLGIEVSRRYVDAADIVVLCVEAGRGLSEEEESFRDSIDSTVVVVSTKSDLLTDNTGGPNSVSAVNGSGLAELRKTLATEAFGNQLTRTDDQPALTRARHRAALEKARVELKQFSDALAMGTDAVVASVHLRAAISMLEDVVGVITTEDVLETVFSKFCIGK